MLSQIKGVNVDKSNLAKCTNVTSQFPSSLAPVSAGTRPHHDAERRGGAACQTGPRQVCGVECCHVENWNVVM